MFMNEAVGPSHNGERGVALGSRDRDDTDPSYLPPHQFPGLPQRRKVWYLVVRLECGSGIQSADNCALFRIGNQCRQSLNSASIHGQSQSALEVFSLLNANSLNLDQLFVTSLYV